MKAATLLLAAVAFLATAAEPACSAEPGGAGAAAPAQTASAPARLGALAPDKALEYMKAQHDKGLVIVEVNTDYWKLKTGFAGALHIPHDEMAKRYGEIPTGVPVILHCGAGVVSVPAYETLLQKRPDIPELSYIAGRPPVAEFNTWLHGQKTRGQRGETPNPNQGK